MAMELTLKQKHIKKIRDAILKHHKCKNVADIAVGLSIKYSTVYYHYVVMVRSGFIVPVEDKSGDVPKGKVVKKIEAITAGVPRECGVLPVDDELSLITSTLFDVSHDVAKAIDDLKVKLLYVAPTPPALPVPVIDLADKLGVLSGLKDLPGMSSMLQLFLEGIRTDLLRLEACATQK